MPKNLQKTYSPHHTTKGTTRESVSPTVAAKDELKTKRELPESSPDLGLDDQWLVADTDFVMGVRRPELVGVTESVGFGEGIDPVICVLLSVFDGTDTTG